MNPLFPVSNVYKDVSFFIECKLYSLNSITLFLDHVLKVNLTESYLFNSQWENMTHLKDLEKQVSSIMGLFIYSIITWI